MHRAEKKNSSSASMSSSETEQTLRHYMRLLDTLINAIPQPIYYRDAGGAFMGCNTAFSKDITGLSRDEVIGFKPQDLAGRIGTELTDAITKFEIKKHTGSTNKFFEAGIRCADGKLREFLFIVTPVSENGKSVSGSIGIMTDLTEKNLAARNQMKKVKFQGVLETAGAVCHEMNQPLQILSGYAELAMMCVDDKEISPELPHQIITQVNRMADITRKLQNIAQYKSTRYGENSRIIDIHRASLPPLSTGENR